MKLHTALLGLVSLAFTLQLSATSNDTDQVVENLLTARTAESFAEAYISAQQAGLPAQVLLEARFLFLVDQQDNKALAALSTELVAASPNFDSKLSSIFSLKEDWLAITHYTQALDALEKRDSASFKKHITEAFWLSPRQASAFAPHIDQYRLDQTMQSLVLPRSLELPNLHDAKKTPLLRKESKATLLYFWSPWSREFGEAIADFKYLASESKKHNIHFIPVLVEQSNEVEIDAKKLINEEKLSAHGFWCTDTSDLTLATALRIQSAPTAVLVSPEGSVLSNSHPSSSKLWNALKKITPKLQPPSALTTK